jgi:hypothetical protein
MTGMVKVLECRALHQGSLRCFCKVRVASGIEIADIAVHQAGSRTWAAPPVKPMIGRDGVVLRDGDGKIRYAPIVSFMTHGVRSNWSRQIIAAIREQCPEALEDDPEKAA